MLTDCSTANVFPDCKIELNDDYMDFKPSKIEVLDIVSILLNRACVRIVKSLN